MKNKPTSIIATISLSIMACIACGSEQNTPSERSYMFFSTHNGNIMGNSSAPSVVGTKITDTTVLLIPSKIQDRPIKALVVLPEARYAVQTETWLAVVDLKRNHVLFEHWLTENAPVISDNSGTIIFCREALYKINTITETSPSGPYFLFKNPGLYSSLDFIMPFKNHHVTGVKLSNTPQVRTNKYILCSRNWEKKTSNLWAHEIEPPPVGKPIVDAGGQIVVPLSQEIMTINSINGEKKSFAVDNQLLSLSVGFDGNYYAHMKGSSGWFVTCIAPSGSIQWQHSTSIIALNQSPICTPNGRVILVGTGRAQSFDLNGEQWLLPLAQDNQGLGTSDNNGFFVLATGKDLLCTNANGEALWRYQNPDNTSFTTQPVIDATGTVWVSDNTHVYCIHTGK